MKFRTMFHKEYRLCKHNYLCDAYLLFVDTNAYWRGLFGFNRQNEPKGIIKIQFGDIE